MSLYRKLTDEELAARDALATAEGNPRLDAKLDRLAARKSRKLATDAKVNAARKRKPKPAPYRPIHSYADIITSPDDPRLQTPVGQAPADAPGAGKRPTKTRKPVSTARRSPPVSTALVETPSRKADRHKDKRAHSAKVAARAKIRRAEAKSTGSAT